MLGNVFFLRIPALVNVEITTLGNVEKCRKYYVEKCWIMREGEEGEEEGEEEEGEGKNLLKIDKIGHFPFVGKLQNTIRICIFKAQTSV